jgi:hypothetical protein
MDKKLDDLYREIFIIEIIVNSLADSQGNHMKNNDQFPTYESIPSNSIWVDEELEEKSYKGCFQK